MVKRAFYQIQPPNRVATGPLNYVQRAGVPLLFRFGLESALFWLLFTPAVADKALGTLGWTDYGWVVHLVTQFAPVAFLAGMALDPMADWFIPTVIGRVPGLKDFWPQMPGPLPVTNSEQAQSVAPTSSSSGTGD